MTTPFIDCNRCTFLTICAALNSILPVNFVDQLPPTQPVQCSAADCMPFAVRLLLAIAVCHLFKSKQLTVYTYTKTVSSQWLLSTLLSQLKLDYLTFGQSSLHKTFIFFPRAVRKETNIPPDKRTLWVFRALKQPKKCF